MKKWKPTFIFDSLLSVFLSPGLMIVSQYIFVFSSSLFDSFTVSVYRIYRTTTSGQSAAGAGPL